MLVSHYCVLFLATIVMVACTDGNVQHSYGVDESVQTQAAREQWIAKSRRLDVFVRVGPNSPAAWVGKSWADLTFEEKQKAAGVLAAKRSQE